MQARMPLRLLGGTGRSTPSGCLPEFAESSLVNFAPLGSLTVYVTSFDRSCSTFCCSSDCHCFEAVCVLSACKSFDTRPPYKNRRRTKLADGYWEVRQNRLANPIWESEIRLRSVVPHH